MTVYVDNMMAKVGRYLMSHMMADSDEELHQMADAIGLKRSWWQPPSKGGSHYDVSQGKKAEAIQKGAVLVTRRQLSAMNFRRKLEGNLGTPEDAEAWLKQYVAQKREGEND